jgi:hypothetical protein
LYELPAVVGVSANSKAALPDQPRLGGLVTDALK